MRITLYQANGALSSYAVNLKDQDAVALLKVGESADVPDAEGEMLIRKFPKSFRKAKGNVVLKTEGPGVGMDGVSVVTEGKPPHVPPFATEGTGSGEGESAEKKAGDEGSESSETPPGE